MDQENEYSDPEYHYYLCPCCGTSWQYSDSCGIDECDCEKGENE